MLRCKLIDAPMDPNKKLGEMVSQILVEKGRCELVGKLIYLARTRANIAFSVSFVSQLMHAPSEEHMAAVC